MIYNLFTTCDPFIVGMSFLWGVGMTLSVVNLVEKNF
jgi:hypothetical protein